MKLDRITKEIDKARAKIAEMQARLADLEKQKTEAENTEIISVVRSVNLSGEGLAALIQSYRESGKPPENMASIPVAPVDNEDVDDNNQEEQYDEDEE